MRLSYKVFSYLIEGINYHEMNKKTEVSIDLVVGWNLGILHEKKKSDSSSRCYSTLTTLSSQMYPRFS